jgi:LysM repeat protein
MAKPMTSAQIVAQLKKWGIKYAEYKSWETHNRTAATGKTFGEVNGFMVHHTGTDNADQRELLYGGVSGLPGPLCHFGLAQDGTVHLIGWGYANHAGNGDPDVLAAVTAENYGAYPPADNESSVDGNKRFYGVEIWYSGSHAMTAAQYATLRKLASAVCDFHKWSEKSVIGHGEWGSPGKWDPGISSGKMMDMAKVRADIKTTLVAGAKPVVVAPKPPVVTPPKPTPVPVSGEHKVVDNDTLYSIATKYKVTVENLKAWNALKSDKLTIGQILKVKAPVVTPPAKPTVQQQLDAILKRIVALEAKLK